MLEKLLEDDVEGTCVLLVADELRELLVLLVVVNDEGVELIEKPLVLEVLVRLLEVEVGLDDVLGTQMESH